MLRNKTGRVTAIALTAALAVAATSACSEEQAPSNAIDANLPKLTGNLGNGLVRTVQLPGEQFTVQTTYTTPYRGSWNITDTKSLRLALVLNGNVPDGTTVYVEHFHADDSLMSTLAGFNGMAQDSMDDEMHSGNEPGFIVTQTHAYQAVFSIEGYSQTLISGWNFQTSGSGAGEVSESRLTEKNLRDKKTGGVTGNKFTFVYDLLVKYKGDAGFHKVSVEDSFAVPVS